MKLLTWVVDGMSGGSGALGWPFGDGLLSFWYPRLMVGGGGGAEGAFSLISFLTGWYPGYMPIQLLVVLGVAFVIFVVGNTYLKKIGKGLPMLAQGVLTWLAAYFILGYVLTPPIPSGPKALDAKYLSSCPTSTYPPSSSIRKGLAAV